VEECAVQVPFSLEDLAEVVGAGGDIGVVGAEGLLVDCEGAAGVEECAVQVPFVLEDRAEVAGADGNGGVVGTKDLLVDL